MTTWTLVMLVLWYLTPGSMEITDIPSERMCHIIASQLETVIPAHIQVTSYTCTLDGKEA